MSAASAVLIGPFEALAAFWFASAHSIAWELKINAVSSCYL